MKMEVLEAFPVSADHAVVKGKRSKRLPPAASAEDSRDSFLCLSPATSTSTVEDEDMANCLILLARGDSPPPTPEVTFTCQVITEGGSTTGAGRIGIDVYQCKTCNRAFPSFQALGGHRTSHKKPKPSAENTENNQNQFPPPPQDEDWKHHSKLISSRVCQTNDQVRPKIHECSICGSEFASGQALGGHMRRHRPPPPPAPIPMEDAIVNHRSALLLDLDLNLPAPLEDDKFNQFPVEQQPHMLLSTAALVDCNH